MAKQEELEGYLSLRNEIDEACNKLWNQHSNNMQCKAGCSSCCQAFKVLPIEFQSIKKAIKDLDPVINKNHKKDECKFLVKNKCSIYEHRPFICRTHGYPLVRLNEEIDNYEVSYCQLNFKDFPLEKFTSDNVFYEDTFNGRLFELNKIFIKCFSKVQYDTVELVELNNI